MEDDSASSEIQVVFEPETNNEEHRLTKTQRVTSPRMSKFEKAYVLGVRAQQLSMNAPPLVDIEYETDPLKIAMKELREGRLPFILRRWLPDNSYEEWNVKEMIISFD